MEIEPTLRGRPLKSGEAYTYGPEYILSLGFPERLTPSSLILRAAQTPSLAFSHMSLLDAEVEGCCAH